MNKVQKSPLEIVREKKLNMKHVFSLGLRAQGKRVTEGEVRRLYDSMCCYISQHAAPSKNQSEVLRLGIIEHAKQMTKEVEAHLVLFEEIEENKDL